jgi:hypothetical protein
MFGNVLKYGVLVVLAVCAAGLLGWWLGSDLTFKVPPNGQSVVGLFWERFQVMFLVAVLIERSVEVYLKATSQDGTESYDAATNTVIKTKDASQQAMIAGLFLGVLVAACGVRIINTFATLPADAGPFESIVWHGIDIFVSAGLMAGGADLFHKLAEVIVGGLDSAKQWAKGRTAGGSAPETLNAATGATLVTGTILPAAVIVAAKSYTIDIQRPTGDSVDKGKLTFTDGGLSITSDCWWDPNNRIDAGTYTKCSKTVMDTLKHDAIYLPDAVSKVSGKKEIFIHHGTSSANSLGCFAVSTENFKILYAHIQPKNGQNITVVVKDV